MKSRPKLGVALNFGLIIVGNVTLGIMVAHAGAAPVLIEGKGSVERTIKYMNFVHFATYGHMSNYFSGVLFAFIMKETRFARELSWVSNFAFTVLELVFN